jgi:4-hydroxybenzoate polyprenyltransferase/phosphoserine phosphatase
LSGRPLIVDLDGTLIQTDVLHESVLRLFRQAPLALPGVPRALMRGKAGFKQYIAERVDLDPATLPYNTELINWLLAQRDEGRRLVLCTASNSKPAQAIADHLEMFDEVLASDEYTNVGGEQKAALLCEKYGRGEFDYVANSSTDLPVWACAAEATVVNADRDLADRAAQVTTLAGTFARRAGGWQVWTRGLRLQQWLKNLLLFAPLLAAHQFADGKAWVFLLLGFFAFNFAASATYVVNDLLDLDSDRLHPNKRNRPLASGELSIARGLLAVPVLLLLSVMLAFPLGGQFMLCLLCYLTLTTLYSWRLKQLTLVDCMTLAMLYTLRIIAGAAALGMGLSFWLLAFSVFLFLSLAFVKRYAELELQRLEGRTEVHGRGYLTSDAPLVQSMGIAAGYVSALVLALYLNSDEVLLLYATPGFVWGAVVILLFWISWMWMQAHRGEMHDDPLVFAVRDRASLVAGVLFLATLWLGTVNFPW